MNIFSLSSVFFIFLFVIEFFSIRPERVQTILRPQNDTTYIYLKDFGLEKTRKKDCTPIVNEALKEISKNKPTKIVFPKGEFHFYPETSQKRNYFESNTSDVNPRNCTFVFEKNNNLLIDGNGCRLIFHGQMQPFTFDECNNTVLKNISIDWEQPLIAQARVLKAKDQYIELAINIKESPYRIDNGKLFFTVGKSGREPWKSTMEFDGKEHFVVPQTGDWGCLGRGWENYLAETTMPGIIRLNFPFSRKPAVGNYLIMRHTERIHSGIFIQNSKNISIKNVNLFHATGLGALAQFSENITFDGYRAIPNKAKNRYFGGGDDGIQVSNCKGQVTITNCEFAGLMDDPVNVHGTSVQVIEIGGKRQLKCRFMHHQSEGMEWGHTGDKISFIENSQMNSIGTGEIERFESHDKETFTLFFKTDIPQSLKKNDALENLTWSPDLHVSNSYFGSCRARGLLVSTPGKVVIQNNRFESSGSAILIAGDANNWFESGAVNDVLIENNIFTDLCNTSSYQFCEGIISIYPEIPVLNESTPSFHKNIRIVRNEFHPFDYPVLFARSVNGIVFENNTVQRSTRFEPWHPRKFTFSFENCKAISIADNIFSEDLPGKNILLKQTNINELATSKNQGLEITVRN